MLDETLCSHTPPAGADRARAPSSSQGIATRTLSLAAALEEAGVGAPNADTRAGSRVALLVDAVTEYGPALDAASLVSFLDSLGAVCTPTTRVHLVLESTHALMDALLPPAHDGGSTGPAGVALVLHALQVAARTACARQGRATAPCPPGAGPWLACTVRTQLHPAWGTKTATHAPPMGRGRHGVAAGPPVDVHEELVLAALGVLPGWSGVGGVGSPPHAPLPAASPRGCTLALSPLPTGYSRDVHGHLAITHPSGTLAGQPGRAYTVSTCLVRVGPDGRARAVGDVRVVSTHVGGGGEGRGPTRVRWDTGQQGTGAVFDDEGDES